jgi:hypothetical protein
VSDWWVEFDAKLAESRAMDEKMEEARTGKPKGGGFSKAEWAEARRRHKERQKQ